jgi:hypothetical protein
MRILKWKNKELQRGKVNPLEKTDNVTFPKHAFLYKSRSYRYNEAIQNKNMKWNRLEPNLWKLEEEEATSYAVN